MGPSARWLLLGASLLPGCKADASLREGLVVDAIATEQTSWPRPSHVASPTPGTFGEAAEPVIAKLVGGLAPLPAPEVILANPPPPPPPGPSSACDDFVRGYHGKSLNDACRAESAKRVAGLEALLMATHAKDAGQPPSLRTTDPALTLPRARAVFLALRDLEIDAHVAMGSGRREEVVAACADRLAIVRDLEWGALLLIDVIGQTSLAQLLASCAEAVDSIRTADRRALADAMEAVGKGMPPFVALVRREHALMQMRAWGDELDDDDRARVPETLRREIVPSEATVDEWRAFRAHAQAAEAAMSAPTAEERLRRMKELDEKAGDSAPQWAKYLALHDRHLAAIDALVWLLRATADEAEQKSPAPLPVELQSFTRVERPFPEVEVVTVTVESDPAREIVLRVRIPMLPPPAMPMPSP